MKLPALLMAVLLAGPVVGAADTLEDKFQALKDAVAKKDVPQVKKLALEVFPLAYTATCEPAPEEESGKEAWASRVAYGKSAQGYAEYALVATALASPAPVLVDFIQTLEQQNAKSQYLDMAYGPYLIALGQTGASAKVYGVADKAIANFPENEDLLLYLADAAVTRKQPDRALNFANRLVAVLSKHSKPEALSAAQWERKRNAGLAHGYWISGVIYAERGVYASADKNLRAALPLIQGDQGRLAPALFHLGMVNYQLGKMTLNKAQVLEGAKFSEQCALISSPYTEQARHNALVIKYEAAKMR